MQIEWTSFTPLSSLVGGLMIGLSTALFILANGRIAGISGIVGGLLRPSPGDTFWRLAFVTGLAVAPTLYRLFAPLPESHVDASWSLIAVAGVLVGVGTRYGSGCTSGHGICGISRMAPRSIVATLIFMTAGFAAVFVVRHLLAGYA